MPFQCKGKMMYKIELEPIGNVGENIVDVLSQVIDITITKKEQGTPGFKTGFWEVTWQLPFCKEVKSTITYSINWSREEAVKHFYETKGLKIAKRNGYKLFKEIE
jgi:hypothetical protein